MLTPSQRETLTFIERHIARSEGIGPGVDDVTNELGLAVLRDLVGLEALGFISVSRLNQKIRVTEPAPKFAYFTFGQVNPKELRRVS